MKKLMFILALAGFYSAGYAQQVTTTTTTPRGVVLRETSEVIVPTERYEVVTNRFFDNWFFSFGGGAQVLFSDFGDNRNFGKRIAPNAYVSLGKWFTPGLGLRLQLSGFQAKSVNFEETPYSYGNLGDDPNAFKEEFKYLNLHGDVLFNVSAMLGGYREDRVYDFIPYIGVGWGRVIDSPHKDVLTGNFGLINRFRLSRAWDMNLELAGMITEDRFDGKVQGKAADIIGSVSLGFAYNFPQRGFKHAPDVNGILAMSQAQIDAINASLARQIEENERLRRELANRPTDVTNEKVIVKNIGVVSSIFFKINSSKLDNQDEVNLREIVEALRNNSSARVMVTGYADSATGNATINNRLSNERAEAVANFLTSNGISRDRIETRGMGGVNTLVPPLLNRRAVIEFR